MPATLTEVEAWVRRAGGMLRDGLGDARQVEKKGAIDLVTEMDLRVESFLVEQIRGGFPDHQIVAEESGQTGVASDWVWYLDPLDGTVNYAKRLPIFAVSLALAHRGRVVLGVVLDPMQEECYTAALGEGAWLNGRRLQVSANGDLSESLLATGFPYDIRKSNHNNLDHYAYFSLRSLGVRRLGSAALDLCYVAAGRFDGFWEIRISPWDIAAGALIVEEAGGKVTNVYGEPGFLDAPYSVLAGNPAVHAQMLGRFVD